jgi:acetoin utilization deacetylase AcuC-like enzyme
MAPVIVFSSPNHADLHDTGTGHPERSERLRAVERGLLDAGLGEAVEHLPGRLARKKELLRVHDGHYLNALSDFIVAGGGSIDPDTPTSPGSWDAALYSAGSGLAAIEALDAGLGTSAFVAMRPPGHHATRNRAMGFCLLNNIAIAAGALADRGERVLIVDWDVHHGNGTQDIFWDDPRVLYASTHEWPAYPGTGRPQEMGGPSAPGLTINMPLPSGATGDVARLAFDQIVVPAAERFKPTWVLISAGFDAHRDDPLAGLEWSASDYADLTRTVAALAPGPGRLIAFLEGGYDLRALSLSAGATVAAMCDQDYRPEPPTSGGPGRNMVAGLWLTFEKTKESSPWD